MHSKNGWNLVCAHGALKNIIVKCEVWSVCNFKSLVKVAKKPAVRNLNIDTYGHKGVRRLECLQAVSRLKASRCPGNHLLTESRPGLDFKTDEVTSSDMRDPKSHSNSCRVGAFSDAWWS
jgi:hypothetical protein